MPMYSDKTNAENIVKLSPESTASFVFGAPAVVEALAAAVLEKGDNARVAVEAWYGVPVDALCDALAAALRQAGKQVTVHKTAPLFIPQEALRAYEQTFLTDDPGFGYVNMDGRFEDILDADKVAALKETMAGENGIVILAGSAASTKLLAGVFDLTCFMDIPREQMLWKMWDGELVPFGADAPATDYSWKEYYYCDYYLLHFQKKQVLEQMDFYLESIAYDTLKLIPRKAYDEMIRALLQQPIKQIKEFQPGPWGAYRYKDLFNVPGLGCNAWNRLASPELGVLVDVGREEKIELPLMSLMQYGRELCGDLLHEKFPDLFPLEIWLDDGYFPEPQPAERISMPIHNHPGSDYVKKHFNEPLGRYETYYIAEAYEGANTWMGFKDDADLEEWERECHRSDNLVPIENWKDYIANHVSNEGDLYLIPPGTVHGHGGNQMVLEMDTCPSIAGTEYSFFEYDFARKTWNDKDQEMTGRPMKMHLEHAFDNEKWRKEPYVNSHLRATRHVTEWNKEYSRDEYSTLPEMPFMVERLHFYRHAENDTKQVFMHILTLTVGTSVRIVSKSDPTRFTRLNRLQSAIIPASFGAYDIINDDGGHSTIVQLRWKEG